MFTNVNSIEELKNAYVETAKTCKRNNEKWEKLNSNYTKLFKKYKNIHKYVNPKTGKATIYQSKTGTREKPTELIDLVARLIKMRGITLEMKYNWLWVGGDTKKKRDILTELGCHYSGKNQAWHYDF